MALSPSLSLSLSLSLSPPPVVSPFRVVSRPSRVACLPPLSCSAPFSLSLSVSRLPRALNVDFLSFSLFLSQLAADFLSTTESSAPIEPGIYNEGGGIFERNGSWYVTFGQGCCFCNKGGSTRVYGNLHLSSSTSFLIKQFQAITELQPAPRTRRVMGGEKKKKKEASYLVQVYRLPIGAYYPMSCPI